MHVYMREAIIYIYNFVSLIILVIFFVRNPIVCTFIKQFRFFGTLLIMKIRNLIDTNLVP